MSAENRSRRWFRRLLRLLPYDFRWKFGEEMEEAFTEQEREAQERGVWTMARLWGETVRDLLFVAPREHLDMLKQDLRYALRTMRRNPGFTAVTVLTLAVAMGANTAVFSLLNSTLLAPLPFRDEQQLVRLTDVIRREDGQVFASSQSQRDFFLSRERAVSFNSLAAQMYQTLSLRAEGGAERAICIAVSDGWLRTLGVEPALGRGFSKEEERAGRDSHAVLISYRFWQRHLGGAEDALGRTLVLDGQGHRVVGVMPPGFQYPYNADLWRPWTFDRNNGRDHHLNVQARMKPGVTLEQARAEMRQLSEQWAREFPDSNSGYTIVPEPTRANLVDHKDRIVLFLLVAVGFVLLIACANVANLLLARALGRQKEFALRSALGASRLRQVRQYITENLLLTFAGGLLGLGGSVWFGGILSTLMPTRLSDAMGEVTTDATVFGFTFLVAAAVGVGVGLFPALRIVGRSESGLLKEGERSGTDASRHRMLNALVVGEVALALLLLAGAGLMGQNLRRLWNADLGFARDNLVSMQIAFPVAGYADPLARIRFVQQALEQIRGLPDVAAAGFVNIYPFTDGNSGITFVKEGEPFDPNRSYLVNHRVASPGYFQMMKIPLLRGRTFSEQDASGSEMVVLVDQAAADRFWPGKDPVGERIQLVSRRMNTAPRTIVGVVGHVVHPTFPDNVEQTVYIPYAQSLEAGTVWTQMQVVLAVRTAADPAAVVEEVRGAVWSVDSNLPVYDVKTAEQAYAAALSPTRVGTILTAFFSACGLLMSALGLYGVMAYAAGRRVREIAVRMALGARPVDIAGMLLGRAAVLLSAGVGLGLGGALLLSRFEERLLAAVGPHEPTAVLMAALVLAGVGLAAGFLPAWRAMKVDPMVVLRCE